MLTTYHAVQNLSFSCLLSKNGWIKIYKTIIFLLVLHGCETWSLMLREKHRQRVKMAVFWVVVLCSLHGAATLKTAIFTQGNPESGGV
jgi:hypothetical protein